MVGNDNKSSYLLIESKLSKASGTRTMLDKDSNAIHMPTEDIKLLLKKITL